MVSNYEVARILMEIAEILEIRGQEPFRVRAYQNAARTILGLSEPLEAVRERGELLALPGIGESIAGKVEEILDTGHLHQHDALVADYPAGVVAMLHVPGIGPRTAEALYHELGITDLDSLESAAREHRIRRLRGFGEKTEANIVRSLEQLRRQRGRMPLAHAYPLAKQVIHELRHRVPVVAIEPAGSLRRMKEDIGDIDILVAADDPDQVMLAATQLPMTQRVLATGATKTSIFTTLGIQVDVRVVRPETFGAALQYFTGSKEHNIKLRSHAIRLGYKVSEYGIFRTDTGERVGGRTEEEIYATLGIRRYPPELREDRGEIELGLRGIVPDFVEEGDILGDLHAHTEWSDGRATIRAMAVAAQRRGYQYVAITDHSAGRGIARGLTIERLRRQIREIRRLNAELPGITILAGSEVDIRRDGSLDFPDDVLAQLDLCVGSIHSAFGVPAEEQTARLLKAMRNPYLDIVGHPTGRLIGSREPLRLDMTRILAEAARLGVILEVNAWPERLDLNDQHILQAREAGVMLAIDSDAHAPEHLEMLRFGLATARRGWAEPRDIVNTLPLPQLLSHLRRNSLRRAA